MESAKQFSSLVPRVFSLQAVIQIQIWVCKKKKKTGLFSCFCFL